MRMLAAVGLADHKDKFPSQLSGGERPEFVYRQSISQETADHPW